MPLFHPPLAHVSQIPVTVDPSLPFVQLSFYAVLDENEDVNGAWEIWTDLPKVDDQGNVISQPAEWRAIAFEADVHRPVAPVTDGHHSDSLLIKAFDNYPVAPSQPRTLSFTLSVPANVGSEFAYTYRHITQSGETHWLGGPGGNGAIKLVDGAAEGAGATQSVVAGRWSDRPEDVVENQWYGVGIEWTGDRGSEKPAIRTFPANAPTAPSVLLLQSSASPHLSSLFKMIPSPGSQSNTVATSKILAVIGTEKAIDVTSSGPDLALGRSSDSSAFGLSHNTLPREALQGAFEAATVNHDRFRLADVQSADGKAGEVAAFFARGGEGDSETTHLTVYAPAMSAARDISVIMPNETVDSTPSFVIGTTGSAFVPASEKGVASSKLQLHLEAGPIAEILRITQFVDLRGAGSDDPIWICAPTATSTVIGEEEIDVPQITADAIPTSYQENPAVPTVVEETAVSIPALPQLERRRSSAMQESFGNSEETQPSHQSRTSASPSWWLLPFLSRFFANIWGWIIWPFRSRPSIASSDEEDSEVSGNAEDALQISTPPTERTPLLGSTSMSRDTSSSSTAFDPLASPTSVTAAKGDAIVTKYHCLDSITPVGTEMNTPILDQSEAPVANSVRIRSYAQMSFDHIPPFRFLLPPAATEAQSKLNFSYKPQSGQEWSRVQPEVTVNAGQCVELLVNTDARHSGATEWDVKVERSS
ncbi:hypothetical protein IAU59_000400 [Kwoniella sp. CBS 9459]